MVDGYNLAVDTGGDLYLAGYAVTDVGLPTTPGAFDTTPHPPDVFVARLRPAGQGARDLIYGSALGGSSDDWGPDVALGPAGEMHLAVKTNSCDFPETVQADDPACREGEYRVFVAAIMPTERFVVSGRILDSAGAPISGIKVGAAMTQTTATNGAGAWALALPAGTYTVAPEVVHHAWIAAGAST